MKKAVILLVFVLTARAGFAQTDASISDAAVQQTPSAPVKKERNHFFYFTWGYNAESYTRSNVHVSQPSLGREYTLHQVEGRDHRGWDEGIFHQELTIPQYSYRIGCMLDKKRGWGVEINFDHTKYIIAEGQQARLTGNLGDGRATDTSFTYSHANGFYYYLNNGANFFLINVVKQFSVWESKRQHLRFDVLAKAGVGPVVPHVENAFFGKDNDPHFQIGGWNTGLEVDAQVTAFKHVFLEYGMKVDYARYSNLRIYEGTARQSFGSFIMYLGLGVKI
ncbi:MAG: hypothetical protein EOP52_11680 [Sphingobacteriales bacterium]|nr:MAG: hypothetical protein EOP52_11680 [Sphingobacteriales bacterium]